MCHLLAFPSRGCVWIKCANVTVVLKGGVCVQVFLRGDSWTLQRVRQHVRIEGLLAWPGFKSSCAASYFGGVRLLVELKGFFFLCVIRSQYFACQHRKEKLCSLIKVEFICRQMWTRNRWFWEECVYFSGILLVYCQSCQSLTSMLPIQQYWYSSSGRGELKLMPEMGLGLYEAV